MYKWRYDQIGNNAYEQLIDIFIYEVVKRGCNANQAYMQVTLDKKLLCWTGSKIPKA